VFSIPFDIPIQLWIPVVDMSLGATAIAACVAMPKAAVNEDHDLVFGYYNVWLTGEVFAVETKPIAKSVQRLAHPDFRKRVFRGYPAHDLGPAFARVHVHKLLQSAF
jgi:hypothetical protein